MKKFTYLAAVALLAVTTLTACGSKSTGTDKTAENNTSVEATDSSKEEGKTVTIEHSLGTVTVPVNPEKTVVFDYGILDDIRALGAETDLAVVTDGIPAYLSEYSKNTSVGTLKEPDLEAIFDYEPDVIFISGRQSSYYDQLSEIAPTVYVELDSTKYMEDFEKNLTTVAQIYGKEDVVEQKMNTINTKVEDIRGLTANLDEKALILMVNDGSISAYGAGSRFGLIHDLVSIKAADDEIEVSTHGMEVNYEYISEVNPDIIFVIDRSEATGDVATEVLDENGEVVEAPVIIPALDNELVNKTNAAKNGRIVKLDGDIWYKAGGGVASVVSMLNEIKTAISVQE